MIQVAKFLTRSVIATTFGAAALLWSGNIPTAGNVSLVSTADAWVGAPATPRSFAGVARRTTRRAVAVTAGAATIGTARAVTVGAATTGAVVVGTRAAVATSNCVRVIGPLGRTATVCR
jgi:hypothetical protein